MKTLNLSVRLFSAVIIILLVSSCENNPTSEPVKKEKISGYVQKGPYLIGTTLNLSELNADLGQTGKVFRTDIENNQGAFEISNIELSSSYVEITANGFYFNEVRGKNSSAQITLSAISDIRDKSSLNVNVLSHLEKDRLFHLVDEGLSFGEAKQQAQEEVLKVFTIEKSDIAESEMLNIAREGEDNAILLAVSVILQGYLDVADMSELIGKLNADLKEDGVLDDESIGISLMNNARLANLENIRSNLEDKYQEMDKEATIPPFETYVQQFIDSSGHEFTSLPIYRKISSYGQNVLYLETDTFNVDQEHSLAAELPKGTSLKIVLSGGMWGYRASPGGPKNWDITGYDHNRQSQEFTATSPGDSSDVYIRFDVPIGGRAKFKIEYYENSLVSPSRTREIVVENGEIVNGSENDYIFPEQGKYGPNLLAMDTDTIIVDKDVKYSFAVKFSNWDDTTKFDMVFYDEGMYTINPSENDHWVIYPENKSLMCRSDGNDEEADMSIIFNEIGVARLTGENKSSILRIK